MQLLFKLYNRTVFLPDDRSLLYTVPWHSPSSLFFVGSWSLLTLSWNGELSYFPHLSFYKMLCLFLEDLIFKEDLSHCNIVRQFLLKDYIWLGPKMAPLNEHRHFSVILCILGTGIHLKFFHNFHFDLTAHSLKI